MFTFIKWLKAEGMGWCPCSVILKYQNKEYTIDIITGGDLVFDDDFKDTEKGPWQIARSSWPQEIPEKYIILAEAVINDNIEWGCCGACT